MKTNTTKVINILEDKVVTVTTTTDTIILDAQRFSGDYVRMDEEDKATFVKILNRICWDEDGFSTLDWVEGEPMDKFGYHHYIESAISTILNFGPFMRLEPGTAHMNFEEKEFLRSKLLELREKYPPFSRDVMQMKYGIIH